MDNFRAEIIFNEEIAACHYKMALRPTGIKSKFLPGQFIHLKINDSYDPLLRRPFSVFSTHGRNIEIIYKVVGKGTGLLSKKKPEEVVDIIGPLGNSFKMPPKNNTCIIVGGGMGVAPLHQLSLELIKRKNRVEFFIGAKAKDYIICLEELKNCLLYTSPSPRDGLLSRMPSSA